MSAVVPASDVDTSKHAEALAAVMAAATDARAMLYAIQQLAEDDEVQAAVGDSADAISRVAARAMALLDDEVIEVGYRVRDALRAEGGAQ